MYGAKPAAFLGFKGPCPRGQNPPIYTVLNAGFSAILPPLGAPWWKPPPDEHFGGPPQKALPRASPLAVPDAFMHGVGFLLRHYSIKFEINKIVMFLLRFLALLRLNAATHPLPD